MATKTAVLNLTKPDLTDNLDITVINGDMDQIDAAIAQRAQVLLSARGVSLSGSGQAIGSYTPQQAGNFLIHAYLRVLGTDKITIAVSYNDGNGAQTQYLTYQPPGLFFPLPSGGQLYSAGVYQLVPLFVSSAAGSTIAITAASSAANQAALSLDLLGV